MAQISEEHIVIKVSQLVRDGHTAEHKLTEEIAASLEAVLSELVGPDCVVEVASAQE